MAGRLSGKTALITGAASGIGEATARRFAAEGAKVLIADIQMDKGKALAAELPGALFLRVDVTKEEDVAAAVALAKDRFGRLDCMINNAGLVGAVGSIRDIAGEDWQATLAVLLNSVFYGMKHAARLMVEQRDGCILSTSSVAGIAAMGPHAYSTAKHAVVGLTRSVASELAQFGVRVNVVAPGTVPTNMTGSVFGSLDAARDRAAQKSPLGRSIEPDDIAGGFLYLASDDARNQTGQVLVIDGGLTACPVASQFHSETANYVPASR